MTLELTADSEDDSPYPEVRAAVANTDDPDMPCATFRAWFVGMIWAILIAGLDQFFFFRFPSVTITSVRASPPAVVHPFGADLTPPVRSWPS